MTDAIITPPFENDVNDGISASMIYYAIPSTSDIIPPYWSPARDRALRIFWPTVDPIKTAVSTFVSKATTIPFSIVPRDRTVVAHVELARALEDNVRRYSGVFNGWKAEFRKFVIDYLTQDNGGFLVTMGDEPVSMPLSGPAYGIYHIDSARVQRTGDHRYPAIYIDRKGQKHKIHHSRLIAMSHLPSPALEMHGVGYSPLSCAIDSALEIRDIYRFIQEKLGSRPKRQIVYVKTGATVEQLREAFEYADEKMDAAGQGRFSSTVFLAPRSSHAQLEIDMVDLASVPDGFDREQSHTINLLSIAAAFGLDPNDMNIVMNVRATTNASAEVQDRKGRGKGVGDLIESVQERINRILLPDYLEFRFDNQDDAQDQEQAKIWEIRSAARQRDISAGITTIQAERARMLRNGEITEEEYELMELADGRLPNGMDVLNLFYSTQEPFASLLSGPFTEILNPEVNNPEEVISWANAKRIEILHLLERAAYRRARKYKQAMMAIEKLIALYRNYQVNYSTSIGSPDSGDVVAAEAA